MVSDVLHIMSEAGSARVSVFLRERGKPAWQAAITHPMVREIAAGTLGHEKFRRYFQQNVLYLGDYARAIGMIVGKSPDLAATCVLSRFLHQITGTEIPANLAFLERLGGAPPGPECMLPTTYAYTSHLLASCATGTCAEGLAALLPCQWSYGELAAPLMASLPDDPVYAEWIAMFGSAGYDALVSETTGLLDRIAEPASDLVMQHLSWIFDTSAWYEVQFWDMAYGEEP
jgi:thiaminase (transcriptional activator TenA)